MYEVPSFILGIYIVVFLLQSGELIAISSDGNARVGNDILTL